MPRAQLVDDHVAAVAVAQAADDSFGGLTWLPNIRARMRSDSSSNNSMRSFGWVMKRDLHQRNAVRA